MTNSVTPFQFALAEQSVEVRVVMRDGEPWFVAKDVADVLGYSDTEAMTRRLKHNEKRYLRGVGTSGGAQEMSILNEPGMYRAIFGSRLESAEVFKDWVFEEVLPSIRKTGSYNADRWHSLEQLAHEASYASDMHADFWTERVRLALELPAFKDVLVRVGTLTAVQEHAVPFILPFVLGGRTVKGLPDDYWSRMLDSLRSAEALTKDEFLRNAALMPKVRRALKEIGWTGNAWNLAEMLYLQDLLEVED